MSKYGIETKKIVTDNFLEKLISENCVSALLLYKKIYKNNAKKLTKIENLFESFPSKEKNFIESLSNKDEIKESQKLLANISKETHKLPVRALTHPMNNRAINQRLADITFNIILRDIEEEMSAKEIMDLKGIRYSTKQKNILRKSIIWVNWFMEDTLSNPFRSNKHIFSETNLLKLKKFKSSEEIIDFIVKNTIKNKKRKIKSVFKNLDQNNISPNQLVNFLSSLSENTYSVLLLLKTRKKFLKDVRKAIYINEMIQADQKDLEKEIFNSLPIYYLSSFKGDIKTYEKVFFKNGFRRVSNLQFVKEEFKNFFIPEKKVLETLEILKQSFSD
tara:strand:+ start:2593 stop:3588 length:996 start_codon:yes stop_codon:yes gene_type:complete